MVPFDDLCSRDATYWFLFGILNFVLLHLLSASCGLVIYWTSSMLVDEQIFAFDLVSSDVFYSLEIFGTQMSAALAN